jgi:WD40 repeat protein
MNWELNVCVSIDERGFIEVWDPNTFDFPTQFPYKSKTQTQFLQLLQANSPPLSLSFSPKGTYLAVILKDKIIRIFSMKTGKLVHTISENIKDVIKIQEDVTHPEHVNFAMDTHEYEKKLNIEKDLEITKDFMFNPNVEFD